MAEIKQQPSPLVQKGLNVANKQLSKLKKWVDKKQQEDYIRELRRQGGRREFESTQDLTPMELWELKEEMAGRDSTPEAQDRRRRREMKERWKRKPWQKI
jgi:hypothetical protein